MLGERRELEIIKNDPYMERCEDQFSDILQEEEYFSKWSFSNTNRITLCTLFDKLRNSDL